MLQLWNHPESVGKLLEPADPAKLSARYDQLHFFPFDFCVHNIIHLKIMKLSGFFIFDAKKSIKQNRQFHSVFEWNLRTIWTKNKRRFPHPSETSCFCATGLYIHFGSIMLHSKISCLNCTRASWKGKAFLSKDNSPFCSFT